MIPEGWSTNKNYSTSDKTKVYYLVGNTVILTLLLVIPEFYDKIAQKL